ERKQFGQHVSTFPSEFVVPPLGGMPYRLKAELRTPRPKNRTVHGLGSHPDRSASTSPRRGNEVCVPALVTDSAATALALRTASGRGEPSDRKTARAPIKASPAPLVSTACTGGAARCKGAGPVTISAPRSPRVTITVLGPRACSTQAAASAWDR